MIKERPCKIVEVTTSKPGKHGHAKANIVAVDIFNGKKMEDCTPSSHNMNVPIVTRNEYLLIDVTDDGYLMMMDDNNNEKNDLKLPEKEDLELCTKIRDMFDSGKNLMIGVISACGMELVNTVKEDTTA